MTGPAATLGQIDLAHEPSFALGPLTVLPATREVVDAAGTREILEPRVMQVLVALAQSHGAILSRDDLTRRCWEGRVVGEDAINRVISRLRRTAEGIGRGALRIETVTKVGYRLITSGDSASAVEMAAPSRPPRRALLAGGMAVAGAAVAGGWWWNVARRAAPAPPPEVAALMDAGMIAFRQTTGDGEVQARGLFQRVTELAPDYAEGWAALAMVYATEARGHSFAEGPGLVARARGAIARAAALDPDNAYAKAAAASLLPANRWLDLERTYRAALRERPQDDLLLHQLARTLARVGRMGEAADLMARSVAATEASPIGMFDLMIWQWGAGRLDEADRTIARALQLFPRNFAVWFGAFYIRLFSGRTGEAIGMAENREGRPATIPDAQVDVVLPVARAMQSRAPAEIDAVMTQWLARAHQATGLAENAMQFAAALDRLDDAFAVASAYFLDRGFHVPALRFPQGQGTYTRIEDRRTWYLFLPSTAAMRADPRFEPLAVSLGLERYWRESRTQPDYRRR